MAGLYIGTSGWTYADWRGRFYPAELPEREWLRFYATQFNSAEINASFYRTPTLETVETWRAQVPRGFRFAWKASKFITHWKRLGATSDTSIALMQSRLAVLGGRLGPVLFQLPARFTADRERLAAFITMLPRGHRYAFEFRNASWYVPAILDLLHDHDIALCLSDHHEAPAPWIVTARHVYVRGHGPGGRYRGRYPEPTLRAWARAIAAWRGERRTVYVYFDNDQKSAAPADARTLLALLHRAAARRGLDGRQPL